ncbi:hypothetical protein CBER1_10751 [Cercospora berteroae]|uniref:Uncharacterized protein n=1 Tax=Cercospora berteroae TaxID=357750 RepID=A0A2S6CND9_9PEZI|nr:hypothetical protein CBER1_10751 [Cercospora berteroae]
MKLSLLSAALFAVSSSALTAPAEGADLESRQTARQCSSSLRDFNKCKRDEADELKDFQECQQDAEKKKALLDACTSRPAGETAQLQREYDQCKREERALERAEDLRDDLEARIERELRTCRRARNRACVDQKTRELNSKKAECRRAEVAENAKDDECDRREDALKASRKSCTQLERDWQKELRECNEARIEWEEEKAECARKEARLCK